MTLPPATDPARVAALRACVARIAALVAQADHTRARMTPAAAADPRVVYALRDLEDAARVLESARVAAELDEVTP